MKLRIAIALLALFLSAQSSHAQRGRVGRVPTRVIPIPGFPAYPDRSGHLDRLPPGPIPFPSSRRTWVRIETGHFSILSSADESLTRSAAGEVERLASFLLQTDDAFVLPRGRSRVFLFSTRTDAQPYFNALRGARVTPVGMTIRHPHGSTALIDSGSRGGPIPTLRHELVHDLLRRDRRWPLWAEEGLAEYHSNMGATIRPHLFRVRFGRRMTLKEIFAMDPLARRATSVDFYAHCWALVAALMQRGPEAFYAFVDDVASGIPEREALQARFGITPVELHSMMRRVNLPEHPRPGTSSSTPPIEIQPMSHAELLFELGDLLARVPSTASEGERHFQAALAVEPVPPRLLVRMAERLSKIPARAHEAVDCAVVALARGADEGRAHAAIGAARALLGEHEIARIHLEIARALTPDDVEAAWHLYSISMATGDRVAADDLFPTLVQSDRATDARRLLLEIDLALADSLLASGDTAGATRILSALVPRMPPKSQEPIEQEIRRLKRRVP